MAKMMKMIAVLGLCITIVTAALFGKFHIDVLLTLAITFGTITYHFLMRLGVGGLLDMVMRNRADYTKAWYQMRPFEEKLYKKLKVKRWKDKMPTYDPELFSLEKHSFDEIAQAMCQAEIVHEIIVVLSFVPLFAAIPFGTFPVFLITSVFAAGLDLMFVIMQRYNRPRIVRLAKRINI